MGGRTAPDLVQENAELRQRVDQLSSALAHVQAVSQLTIGAVHDLRNAFHVVHIATEALRATVEDPEQVELADTVLAAAEHATSIARELLSVARRESGRAMRIDCRELLASVEPLIRRAASKRVSCSFDVEPDVATIEVERRQLEAALINLSVNARDAMPEGGRMRVIARNIERPASLGATLAPGHYVEVSVEDSGAGMPASIRERATEAFFTTKGSNGGTGLGLAMVQAFVARSGGALRIESEPGRGTRVAMILPRAPLRVVSEDATDRRSIRLAKLRDRIRTAWLADALEAWRAACSDGALPQPLAVQASLGACAAQALVLAVDRGAAAPCLRLTWMGDGLRDALGQRELGNIPLDGNVALGSLEAAYRRALRSHFPNYEYAKYALGDGPPGEFERLILPAAHDGHTVSHLIGVVRLSAAIVQGGES